MKTIKKDNFYFKSNDLEFLKQLETLNPSNQLPAVYVSMVATNSYAYGAIGFYYTWLKTNSKYKMITIVTDNVSEKVQEELIENGLTLFIVPNKVFTNSFVEEDDRYRYTINKFYLHALAKYFKRAFYCDATVLAMYNCDDIIENNDQNCFWGFVNPRYNEIRASGSMQLLWLDYSIYERLINGDFDDYQTDEQVTYDIFGNKNIPLFKDSVFYNKLTVKSSTNKYWFWEKFDSPEKIKAIVDNDKWELFGYEYYTQAPQQRIIDMFDHKIGWMNVHMPEATSLHLKSLSEILTL